MIMYNNISFLRRTINNKFYSNRIDLFKILRNAFCIFKQLEEDLSYELPDPIVKIHENYIELTFDKIIITRFYINTFNVYIKNKCIRSCNYYRLKSIFINRYKLSERSLAFSLDTLTPGLYFWFFNINIRLGGSTCTVDYFYSVPTKIGFGIIIPNYIYWHTPFKYFKSIHI